MKTLLKLALCTLIVLPTLAAAMPKADIQLTITHIEVGQTTGFWGRRNKDFYGNRDTRAIVPTTEAAYNVLAGLEPTKTYQCDVRGTEVSTNDSFSDGQALIFAVALECSATK